MASTMRVIGRLRGAALPWVSGLSVAAMATVLAAGGCVAHGPGPAARTPVIEPRIAPAAPPAVAPAPAADAAPAVAPIATPAAPEVRFKQETVINFEEDSAGPADATGPEIDVIDPGPRPAAFDPLLKDKYLRRGEPPPPGTEQIVDDVEDGVKGKDGANRKDGKDGKAGSKRDAKPASKPDAK